MLIAESETMFPSVCNNQGSLGDPFSSYVRSTNSFIFLLLNLHVNKLILGTSLNPEIFDPVIRLLELSMLNVGRETMLAHVFLKCLEFVEPMPLALLTTILQSINVILGTLARLCTEQQDRPRG